MSTLDDARISVIIPARNEEGNIARVVKSIAHQPGMREIVVVDDQSTDRTAEILRELKLEFPQLRTLSIQSLPQGWMGKTHAVAEGAKIATGEWLLFTDADTQHFDGSMAELLQRAEAGRVDLLSLSPGQETPTWWEKSVIPLVFVKLSGLFRFEDVCDPRSPVAAANGQYVLIRREIYERSGGHEAVKSAILEDVELARRVKAMGGKLLFLPGPQWVRTRMYQTFGSMWQGWTKNLYLLYGGNRVKMLSAMASLWLIDVLPTVIFIVVCGLIGLGRGGTAAVVTAVLLLVVALARRWSYGRALQRLGFASDLALYQPLGAVLLGTLMLNSMHAHRSTGSIQWKGRRYATKGQG